MMKKPTKLIFHSPKSRCKLIKLSSFAAVKDIRCTRYKICQKFEFSIFQGE